MCVRSGVKRGSGRRCCSQKQQRKVCVGENTLSALVKELVKPLENTKEF